MTTRINDIKQGIAIRWPEGFTIQDAMDDDELGHALIELAELTRNEEV